MGMQWNLLAFPLFLSGFVTLTLAIYGWRRRRRQVGRAFMWMMIGGSVWSFAGGLESLAATEVGKIVWISLELRRFQ